MAVTHRTIEHLKETIKMGKTLLTDPERINTSECIAWKLKSLYALKRLIDHGVPDINVLEEDCSPHIALAHLEIAYQSAAFWLSQQEKSINPNKRPGKVLLCLHCGNKTHMDKVSSYSYEDRDQYTCSTDTWSMFFCPVCSKVTLEHSHIFSEDCDFDEFGNYGPYKRTKTLYPHPSATSQAGLPESIKNSFDAAQKVRHIDGAVCALSLRRTLEMICKDKGETSGNLFNKLQNLSNKGILPPILDQIASVLRELGNVAAHADDIEYEFPSELVPELIEFTDIILNYLYVLPAKIQDIQSKMKPEQ